MILRRQFGSLVLALTLALTFSARADEVSTYAQIEPSLALIISKTSGGMASGTGFCIENDVGAGHTYGFLLTNKHVVGNDKSPTVVLMSDPQHIYRAPIVRYAEIDAVVLAVPIACQPIRFGTEAPPVGTRIALAGFPAFQMSVFAKGLGLSPSFHEGTISSLIAGGGILEYDAQTDHGNSGSPLFDVNTGDVYGLVTMINTGSTGALQNNIAIGSGALEAFLQNAHHDIVAGLEYFSEQRSVAAQAEPTVDPRTPIGHGSVIIGGTPSSDSTQPEPTVDPRTPIGQGSVTVDASSTSSSSDDPNDIAYVPHENDPGDADHPFYRSTPQVEDCVNAYDTGNSHSTLTYCKDVYNQWEITLARTKPTNTRRYISTELETAYFVCYIAKALSFEHLERAHVAINRCRELMSDVIANATDHVFSDRAEAALNDFEPYFSLVP